MYFEFFINGKVMTPGEITAENQLSDYEIDRDKAMPSKNHAIIQANLTGLLWMKYRSQYSVLTELNLILPGTKHYVPDLCIYPKLATDWLNDEKNLTVPPLVAVEIQSASQSGSTFEEKFKDFFAGGVKSCWYVLPSLKTIFILTPDQKISVFHEGTLTDPTNGITLEMKDVFE